MTTPTQPAEPSTEAGRELLDKFVAYKVECQANWLWTDADEIVLAAVLAAIPVIEAEASRDAGARVEGPDAAESVTVLRDVLETIEKLYHPEIGWYVHPVYMRAARLVDGAALAAEPVPAAGLDVERLTEVLWTTDAYWRFAHDEQPDQHQRFHDWAAAIAAAYAAAAPQPARETEAAGDAGHG